MFKDLKDKLQKQEFASNLLGTGAGLIDNLVSNVKNFDINNPSANTSRSHSPRSTVSENMDQLSNSSSGTPTTTQFNPSFKDSSSNLSTKEQGLSQERHINKKHDDLIQLADHDDPTLKEIHALKKAKRALEDELALIKDQIQMDNNELADIITQAQEKDQELRNLEKRCHELESALDLTQKSLQSKEEEYLETKAELETTKEENSVLKTQIEQQIEKLEEHVANSLQAKETNMKELQKNHDQLVDKYNSLKEDQVKKEEELKRLTDQLADKQSEYDKLKSDLYNIEARHVTELESMKRNFTQIEKEKEQLEAVIYEKESLLSKKEANISQLEETLSTYKTQSNKLQKSLEGKDQTIADFKEQLDKATKSLADKTIELEKLKETRDDLTKELEADNKRLKDDLKKKEDFLLEKSSSNEKLEELVSSLKGKIGKLEKSLEERNEKFTELKGKLIVAESTLNNKLEAVKKLEDSFSSCKAKLTVMEKECEEKEKLIHEMKPRIDLLTEELVEANAKVDQLMNENSDIENERISEKNRFIDSLEAKIANLVTIESEFDLVQDKLNSLEKIYAEKFASQAAILRQYQRDKSELQSELESLKTQLNEKKLLEQSSLKSKEDEIEACNRVISRLKDDLEKLQSKKSADGDILNKVDLLEKEKSIELGKLTDTVTSLELKLREKESEIESLMERFHSSEDKIIYGYKKEIELLETELTEKNSALEEVHQHYQQILEEKETELKQIHNEFNSSSVNEHSFQVKAMQKSLLQYQEENLRLKELFDIRQKQETSNNLGTCYLPEPTEYEYLRNIIFEYMMGREPMTLAKVIAAVLRFSNDQTEQLIRRQEHLINTTSLMPLR